MRPFVCYTICLLNQLTFRPKVTGANSVSPSFKSYCRSIARTELNGVNHISHRFCYHFRFAVSSSFLKNDMQTLPKKLLIWSIGHWIKNNILRGSESLSRLCLNLTTNFDWSNLVSSSWKPRFSIKFRFLSKGIEDSIRFGLLKNKKL